MKKYKIGEKIILDRDIKLKRYMSGTEITAKKGSRGIVTSRGNIVLLTGNAQQNIIQEKLQLTGYDTRNIALEIMKRLQLEFDDLRDFFEDYEIEGKDFIDVIDGVLDSVL